jgi:Ca2+-transporting ATPase
MGFMNTTVTRGRGEVVVTATGMESEIGRLAGLLDTTDAGETPLQRQIHQLSVRLALVAAVAVTVFFVLGMLRGEDLADTLLSSVALAVAAIPEGLPAILTVTLAVGVSQMAKRGAIVKRLASVETLGSTSVICSDKTGTLTLNVMTARRALVAGRSLDLDAGGTGADGALVDELAPILAPMVLCSDARMADGHLVGDPTEGALVVLAERAGVDVDALRATRPRVAEVPFDGARKFMVTFHERTDGGADVYVKGALDALLPRTRMVLGHRGSTAVADATPALHAWMEAQAAEGQRVLAFAVGRVGSAGTVHERAREGEEALLALVEDLVLGGLVALVDPPRPEAKRAIAVARRAGVDVKMITGDHAATATAIAAELGIRGRAVSGGELEAMTDHDLRAVVEEIGVFARVAPEHKLRIVRALQAQGHVVAMTGDGVNDAPALKQADVGVAMGITGTEVSKEAASMVLVDDDMSSIVRAIEQGRAIYANIVTFVRFQLATNLGAIGSLVGAPIVGLPVPFTAIQVLWVNLIMDGPPAIALGVDPPKADAMTQPPRDPRASILSARRLSVLVLSGFVMTAGTLGVLAWAREVYGEATGLTMAFSTFVLFQVANALNARNERGSVFRAETLRNLTLWVALAGVVVLQVAAVHLEAGQNLFDTVAMTETQWGTAVAVASSILWIEELRKLGVRRRARS